jgi:anti-anti-sigma factor
MTPWAKVTLRVHGGVPIATVDGEIDISNVEALREKILQDAPNDPAGLVVDLSTATYIDSQGVHLLLDLAERLRIRRQRLVVVAPRASFVRRIIELSQLHAVIPVESEVGPAIAVMQRPVGDADGGTAQG